MIYAGSNIPRGLIGGLILGASSSAFMLTAGRITGISGILDSALTSSAEISWPIAYILGLLSSGVILKSLDFPGLADAFDL